MCPVLRREGEVAPCYSPDSSEFSIEVHHGGFFCGLGVNRTYMDQKISWFDHMVAEDFSYVWIENMVLGLDYNAVMRQLVHKVKNFVLYFDHHGHIGSRGEDTVVEKVANLPKVSMSSRTQENGPRLSKHGAVMRCSYCKDTTHNARTCELKKADVMPDKVPKRKAVEPSQELEDDDPVITQDIVQPQSGYQQFSDLSNTMLRHMWEESSQSSQQKQQLPEPLPDCAYIQSNRPVARPMPLSTTTIEGKSKVLNRKVAQKPTKKGQATNK